MKNSFLLKLSNIFFATGIALLLVLINGAILTTLMPLWGLRLVDPAATWQSIVRGLTIAPLGEEFIFRYLPITLACKLAFFKEDKENLYLLIAILGGIFGYIHGGYYNILIQGVAGFFFGWVYVKNGMSYWSAVAAHFIYNLVVSVVFPVII